MRNLKKFLALVLAFVMAMSLMVTVNAAPAKPEDFGDVSAGSSSYAEAINVLSALGVINGYETDDGTIFNPKGEIKRSEVAAILYRIANNDAAEEQVGIYKDYNRFSDVPSDAWYAGAVNYCANSELVVGVGDDRYAPHSKVTGYQVLAMVLRMLGYDQNGEFEGSGWQIRTASYARQVGLTKNIKEGTLGANATREMVAEIMFQALQAPTVSYSLLTNYTPNDVLIADNANNREAYGVAIEEGLTLPLYGTKLYRNYGIVGKTDGTPDPFGRPTEAWVTDNNNDKTVRSGDKWSAADETANSAHVENALKGDAGKYIVNVSADADDDVEALLIAVTPVAVYTDAIDECHMTKDINDDESIDWAAITEIVNGETASSRDKGVADNDGDLTKASGVHLDGTSVAKLDALHTSTKFVNATGRTLEVYKTGKVTLGTKGGAGTMGGVSADHWIFVYIDTFLGEVVSTTDEVKDSAGHTIIDPTADVHIGTKGDGTGDELVEVTLANPNGKYKKGDLVLVQTPNAQSNTYASATDTYTAGADFITDSGRNGTNGIYGYPDPVTNPERAPLVPTDVPNADTMFTDTEGSKYNAQILPSAPTTVRVTINATVGAQDMKMGVISTDGKTYMASNTFLAGRPAAANYNKTVLDEWYDVPNGRTNDGTNKGIVNGMIGKTYDIVLDQNDHIIGMKEVATVNDGVGVITSIDSVRVGGGKYVSEVEAYMTDGTTQTFQLLGYKNGKGTVAGGGVTKMLDKMTDTDYGYFESMSEADAAWGSGGLYEKPGTSGDTPFDDDKNTVLNIGSLVQFKSLSLEGKTFYKIVDWDHSGGTADNTAKNLLATGEVENADGLVKTGQTGTLKATPLDKRMLDDKSVVFVAEYEYRYNTGDDNDGSNINKTYKVYEGFKKMPTVKGDKTNILWQQLGEQPGNDKYVLVYAKDADAEYVVRNPEKITVDDSYLILSRGATYAEYSVYNTLKNGEPYELKVSNANKNVNALIEATMDTKVVDATGHVHLNELVVVTGTNAKGYVTSVSTVNVLANINAKASEHGVTAANTTAVDNIGELTAGEIIAAANTVAYKNGVLATVITDDSNDTTYDGTQHLTLDDNVKVQLVNRDMKTVTEISLDVAMVYANGSGTMTAKPMVFELNELGYICNLYVME